MPMGTNKAPKKAKLETIVHMPDDGGLKMSLSNPKTELDMAFRDFLMEKKLSGKAEKTVKSYQSLLTQAFMFVPFELYETPLSEWTQVDIQNIVYDIASGTSISTRKPLAKKTIESYLRNFRIFIAWCVATNRMKNGLSVQSYRAPQSQPKMYTDEELRIILTPPAAFKPLTFLELRNYVMCLVLTETGIRKNSLLNLTINDVDLRRSVLTIRTSKNKYVYCTAFSDTTKDYLERYISVRTKDKSVTKDDYLFTDSYQRQLTEYGIVSILKKYITDKGVQFRGLHAFRHSCATRMAINGATSSEIAQQTGHRDIKQVDNYVHAVTALDKEKFDKYTSLSGIV